MAGKRRHLAEAPAVTIRSTASRQTARMAAEVWERREARARPSSDRRRLTPRRAAERPQDRRDVPPKPGRCRTDTIPHGGGGVGMEGGGRGVTIGQRDGGGVADTCHLVIVCVFCHVLLPHMRSIEREWFVTFTFYSNAGRYNIDCSGPCADDIMDYII